MAKTSVTWKKGGKEATMKDEKGSITCVGSPLMQLQLHIRCHSGERQDMAQRPHTWHLPTVDMIEPPQFTEEVQKSPSDIGTNIQTSKLLSRPSWTAVATTTIYNEYE